MRCAASGGEESGQAMTKEQQKLISVVRSEGQRLSDVAGYQGRMDDGGGGHLIELADAWEAGLRGVVPMSLRPYEKAAAQDLDPEWAEYQRLSRKLSVVSQA